MSWLEQVGMLGSTPPVGSGVKWRTVSLPVLTTAAGGSTQDFSIPGFGTPQAWIVAVTWADANQTVKSGASLSVGLAFEIGADEDHRHSETRFFDGVTVSGAGSRSQGTGDEMTVEDGDSVGNAVVAEGAVITDGVQFTYGTRAPVGAAMIAHVTLISGLDDVYVSAEGTGTDGVVTGVGFQPNALIVSTQVSTTGRFGASLGFAVDTGAGTEQCSTGMRSIDNTVPVEMDQVVVDGSFLSYMAFASSIQAWDIDSWDVDGFTFSQSQGTADITFQFMALKFPAEILLDARVFGSRTSVGTDTHAVGFQPQGGLLASTWCPTEGVRISATDLVSQGFHSFNANEQISASVSAEDNANPTVAKSYSSTDGFDVLDPDGTLGIEATVGLVSGGVDLVYTATDATERFGLMFSFGEPPAPVSTVQATRAGVIVGAGAAAGRVVSPGVVAGRV